MIGTSPPILRVALRDALARRVRVPIAARPGERAAAVLIPLLSSGEVLFIVRPTTMPTHAGQVAFPGGSLEPGEAAIGGALRETEEELGIPRDRPDVLGCLDDLRTHTGFVITPVVAIVPDAPLDPSPREVHATFRVPLARLADPRLVRTARGVRGLAPARASRQATEMRLHFWIAEPWVIWGATGHILSILLDIVRAEALIPA